MSDKLYCDKNDTIAFCPICGSTQEIEDKWPTSGTHAFTIPYICGTTIDYPIGYDGASYGKKCNQ